MDLDRRNFLKGAAVTAVGAVGAATLAACSPASKADKDAEAANAGVPEGESYNTAATAQRKWAFEIPPAPIADADINYHRIADDSFAGPILVA
ncbi:twin-arginine translocation signal domain-containing protein [Paraeggerthella sp.]|uniref:twin-arginine translocation signal domain-containing protein n=1 Tax=Paraeggerthella sp. TaxID=2897350 RepID=UPI003AB5899E